MPMSYTEKSPAIMRAMTLDYDPYRQVQTRLKAFEGMKHPTTKIEMIYLGGTFLAYPAEYQYEFVKRCYDGLNGFDSETLEKAQQANETAKQRCVALCIETKPDWAFEKEINRLLEFGVTRVELGVQLPDDEIYKATNRGHTVADVIKATQLLKDSGFKAGYHIMPGMPGSNPEKDIKLFEQLFSNPNFRPDQLKIYPCQVMEGTPLAKQYEQGLYKPYDAETIVEVVAKMKSLTPKYCRIMRIMRQFPPTTLKAGTHKTDLRIAIKQRMEELGLKCNCIRCREIGFNRNTGGEISIEIDEYKASGGREFFITAENEEGVLFGLLRARIPSKPFRPEITAKTLVVRELHVYGNEVGIGEESTGLTAQHKGLGKKLMAKAEEIALEEDCEKVIVISGVGVREYYRKLGYVREGMYMEKDITRQ